MNDGGVEGVAPPLLVSDGSMGLVPVCAQVLVNPSVAARTPAATLPSTVVDGSEEGDSSSGGSAEARRQGGSFHPSLSVIATQ